MLDNMKLEKFLPLLSLSFLLVLLLLLLLFLQPTSIFLLSRSFAWWHSALSLLWVNLPSSKWSLMEVLDTLQSSAPMRRFVSLSFLKFLLLLSQARWKVEYSTQFDHSFRLTPRFSGQSDERWPMCGTLQGYPIMERSVVLIFCCPFPPPKL